QRDGLRDELAEQPRERGSQSPAYRDFPPPVLGAYQHQPHYIDTGDQQQQHRSVKQNKQHRTDRSYDSVADRLQVRALAAIGVRILSFEFARDRLYVGEGGIEGDAVAEAGNAENIMAASTQIAIAGCVVRGPELGPADGREMEVPRQDARYYGRHSVDRHRLS